MKTPTSSESGYFYLRISAASVLCLCGVWLAVMSFVPSASAWNATSGGSPGNVTWADVNAPVIGMGWGDVDFQIYRAPTISMSSAGTYWQYAAVTLYVYYLCEAESGEYGWCYYYQDTKNTLWTPYGATATTVDIPRVHPIPPGNYYWTSFIQIIWYNDMRYTSSQQAAWENFYPTNPVTTYFNYVPGGDPDGYQYHGNADMAITTFAEDPARHAGKPYGALWSYNLLSPTGYIYVLQGL